METMSRRSFNLYCIVITSEAGQAAKGWLLYDRRRSQTIADRKSQIADDRKESCFHMIADDRKRSQSRLLHTFRTAEVSKFNTRKLC